MLHEIKYNIDKIKNQQDLTLASLGDVKLLNPVLTVIIYYCKLCSVPKIETDDEIAELWFRINYLRNFGFAFYRSNDGGHHPFEPYYGDLVRYRGVYINELPYQARKQWLNAKIDMFIAENRKISESEQLIKPNSAMLKLREDYTIYYMQEQMDIKHLDVAGSRQQQQNQNQFQHPNQPQELHNKIQDRGPLTDHTGQEYPEHVVYMHKQLVTKGAIEKRRKGEFLTQEEKELLDVYDKEQLIKKAKEPVIEKQQSPVTPANPSAENKRTVPKTGKKPVKSPAKPVKNITKKSKKR